MSKLQELKKHLRAGQVYRRADLTKWSTSVDRHLRQLVEEGFLEKVSGGVYSRPKRSVFGNVPAADQKLVEAFLKDSNFLVTSPNHFNSLGLGLTQLRSETVVYNLKRHGEYTLGGRTFKFKRVYRPLPKALSREFLLVDLVDNLRMLGEDAEEVATRVREKAAQFGQVVLARTAQRYGGAAAKRFFATA